MPRTTREINLLKNNEDPIDQDSTKGNNPLVSVIVPNYNYGRHLGEAIDSVLGQTHENVEMIVVDDGSTDDSRDVLSRYQGRVRSFFQKNQGVSAARNLGIAQCRGELVAFLDADDVWVPEKLERQIALLDNPSVGLVFCGLHYVDSEGRELGTNLSGRRGRVLTEAALLRGAVVLAAGSSVLVRKSALDVVGPFDVELSTAADWDLCRRVACHYEVDFVEAPLLLYRQHPGAMHRNVELFERDMLHAFESMFADPAAAEIYPLRRRCYGNLYLSLAGSYLHAGKAGKCLAYLVRGLAAWPPGLSYVLAMPFRRLVQRLHKASLGSRSGVNVS